MSSTLLVVVTSGVSANDRMRPSCCTTTQRLVSFGTRNSEWAATSVVRPEKHLLGCDSHAAAAPEWWR